MHELALCRSIATIVARAAEGRPVALIELDIGELRQVVPATLEHCWRLVGRNFSLGGSQLVVRRLPGVIVCADCGVETRLEELPILRCGSCAGTAVRITSGEEFIVRAIELEE